MSSNGLPKPKVCFWCKIILNNNPLRFKGPDGIMTCLGCMSADHKILVIETLMKERSAATTRENNLKQDLKRANVEIERANAELERANAELERANAELERAALPAVAPCSGDRYSAFRLVLPAQGQTQDLNVVWGPCPDRNPEGSRYGTWVATSESVDTPAQEPSEEMQLRKRKAESFP